MVVLSGGLFYTATPLGSIQITALVIPLCLGLTEHIRLRLRSHRPHLHPQEVRGFCWADQIFGKKPAQGVFSCRKEAILIHTAVAQG
jgi:hypothetical protein